MREIKFIFPGDRTTKLERNHCVPTFAIKEKQRWSLGEGDMWYYNFLFWGSEWRRWGCLFGPLLADINDNTPVLNSIEDACGLCFGLKLSLGED